MKSLFVVSKHILYNVGGAEKSILKYVDGLKFKKIFLLGFKNSSKKITHKNNYHIKFFKGVLNLHKFYFFEYFLNKKILINQLKKEKISHLISYGIYYPAIINSCENCFKELHIRSETDLGIFINYNSGYKYLIKMIMKILEFPFEYFYKIELKRAILNADKIICNSKFIQFELFKMYAKKSEVIYPKIDINNKDFKSSKEGIVFIGDSKIKGIEMVKSIAKEISNQDFYIFGRNTKKEKRIKNIVYCPWEDDVLNIYKRAKLVIVPSLWKEAYGRVAKESIILNIPVLVSDIGGLKEAVNYDDSKLIKNYSSKDEWIKEINNILNKE